MDLTTLAPSWEQAKSGITIELMMMHGDADAITSEYLEFPFNEKGFADARLAIAVLPVFNEVVCENREGAMEGYCKAIAKRLAVDYGKVYALLQHHVICDAQCDDYTAEPVAYKLTVTDKQGVTQTAMFSDERGKLKPFCKIGDVDSAWVSR